ncbi:MAG TPA: ABC transporter ATP-binding protein [Thermoanaerobaculia bacterium]|nr:ABC transporter ATP-binding protein [Thermoanaerobaculia bacterium]
MSSDSLAIHVENVSKSYRLWGRRSQFATLKSALLKRDLNVADTPMVPALRNVSFAVDRGEAFGIVGRNGSGKSTLLKIITGILKPTSGRIAVHGRIAALIELGAGFHPEITGRENIYINGIMLGLSRREIEQRFDKIVEFSGIGDFLDQPVKTYSSGMYVRLGFAVAVHVDPDILLIDEVLAVGDEEFSARCVAKIQEMKYRGVTLVFVTHQLDQVRTLCDRAVWLDHGECKAIGDPMRVVDAYLQEVSAPVASAAAVETPAAEEPPPPAKDPMEEERWGSGEVVLKAVRVLDDRDRELVALGAGTPVTIEIDVETRVPQEDFVFGIGIYHADGTCVYGTNTDIEGHAAQRLEGSARVRFVMRSLDLVAGTYRIDVAVHTRNGRAFDYRRGAVRVVVGSRVHDIGVYRPQHTWQFEGGATFRSVDTMRANVPESIAEAMQSIAPPDRPAPTPPGSKAHRLKGSK